MMEQRVGWKLVWLSATGAALIVLLCVQIFWFVGTTTLRDYQFFRNEVQQITDEISRIRAASGNTDATRATTESLLEPLRLKLLYSGPQLDSTLSGLQGWTGWVPDFGTPPEMDADSAKHYVVRKASSATQVLGLYILPLLYGLLGALVAVVKMLREDDSDDAIRKLRPGARVVTGMVAGPMIGMFISPEFLNSLAFQATPFLIAFIGGYATDVFFALTDKFLNNFRTAISRDEKDG